MFEQPKEIYEFSRFRLEVFERKLLRDGKTVALTDKAFDTLCVLVRRAGELVSKDELMVRVWPDTVVEENNLDQKISIVRRALREKARGKEKFIETVRGHGYRFLPEVKMIRDAEPATTLKTPASVPSGSSAASHSFETRREGNVVAVESWQRPRAEISLQTAEGVSRNIQHVPLEPVTPRAVERRASAGNRNRRLFQYAVLTAVIVGLSFLAWTLISSLSETATDGSVIESIAVMPFVNETGNPDNDFLSDGLTESLIGSLSQIQGLSVKARNSVFQYKDKEINASTVAAELSVSGILLGRFTQHGDKVTLGLELVDARTGNATWAETYQRPASEIVSLQSEIARDVATKLRSRLSQTEQDRITKTHTADPEANRLYLQGMYHLNKRTAEDIRKSSQLFEQATARDPAYAKAHAGAAMSYLILPDYSHGLVREELLFYDQKFRAAVQRAYEADSNIPETALLVAALKDTDWDVEGAVREYERAIELDPSFATPRHWYSRFLGGLGRYDEALFQINKARELDPHSRSIAFNVGARLADARRFDEAIAQYNRVLEMEPDHPLTHFALGLAYDAKGLHKEAISKHKIASVLLEKETEPQAELKAHELSKALESGGAQGYWQKRLEHSRRDREKGFGSDYNIAVCLARLLRFDEALEQLGTSLGAREPALFWIKTESAFDPISNDPRFKNILRQIGLPQ